ncbi:MAG: PAS domain-containing sensor histidine kinase [Reichenbachiella sp.]|uniref:sensor histidine kinase n=1 Tax=Reichenbachiella sp. TaxID=2184521 RepID=UPI003263055E
MIINKGFTETNDFLLSVIGGAPYGIIAIDLEGHITIANGQALTQLQLSMRIEELVEMDVLDVVGSIQELKKQIEKCLTRGRKDFDLEEVTHMGRYLSFRGRKILNGMIITIADITSIKESKYTALNSLMEGQELERKRLAREIHDGIGPTLSAVKMNLSNIEGDIENLNHSLGEKFRKSYQMIDEAADDLRSISHNLMPKVLSDFGLIEALETLCEKIDEIKSVSVDYINTGFKERLDEVTELGLYRVSQELINNTLKYAQAKRITLQLIKREANIQLMYEDDGKGFYPDTVRNGIGLMNIENRVKAMAGQLIIDSQPGKGMTATIDIPIN